MPETLPMLFPLPKRSSPNPPRSTCPKPAQLTSTSALGLPSDVTSSEPHPEAEPGPGLPYWTLQGLALSLIHTFPTALPFSHPSFLFSPSFLPQSTYSLPALGTQDRHGPSTNSECSRGNRRLTITQMQMENCEGTDVKAEAHSAQGWERAL